MAVFQGLLKSRRFWISLLAVLINLLSVVLPPVYAAAVQAFNIFALALITAYTIEDTAIALRK